MSLRATQKPGEASPTEPGLVEFATDAETIAGTATDKATTPANIQAKVASATAKGIVELLTDAEAVIGTDTTRAATAANMVAKMSAPGPFGDVTPAAVTSIEVNIDATVPILNWDDGSGRTAFLRGPSTSGNMLMSSTHAMELQPQGTSALVLTSTVATVKGLIAHSTTAGITADTGSVQGGSPLTKDVNEISTCANAGDSVTMPTAVAGYQVVIINNGANACDVFPASGDDLGAGADAAVSLAASAAIRYTSYNATNWVAV